MFGFSSANFAVTAKPDSGKFSVGPAPVRSNTIFAPTVFCAAVTNGSIVAAASTVPFWMRLRPSPGTASRPG